MIFQENDIKNIGELIEPDKLEMTYATPGWYAVFILSGVIVMIVLYMIFSNWMKNKYRRDAIIRIEKANTISEINETLKFVALRSYGRKEVANLSSDVWVDFLNSKSKANFQKEIFNLVYSEKEVEKEMFEDFKKDAVWWVKGHK